MGIHKAGQLKLFNLKNLETMKTMKTQTTFLLVGLMLLTTVALSQEKEVTQQYTFMTNRGANRLVVKNIVKDIKIVGKDAKLLNCTRCIHTWFRYDSLLYKKHFSGGSYRTPFSAKDEGKDLIYEVKSQIANSYTFLIQSKLNILIDNTAALIESTNISKGGKISIEGVESEININTLTSDIKLKDVSGPIVISSVSGDVDIELSKENLVGPISIGVLRGNITLRLPATANANIIASNLTGEIISDFATSQNPIETEEKTGIKIFKTNLNLGGNSIFITTGSGNISIVKY